MQDDSEAIVPTNGDALFGDVATLIEGAHRRAAAAVNSELVMLYWSVGKRVREEVLGGERAAYGQQIIKRLTERLTERYGRGWSRQNLERMIRLVEWLPDREKCSPVASKLTWTNVSELLTIPDQQEREFYGAHWADPFARAKDPSRSRFSAWTPARSERRST